MPMAEGKRGRRAPAAGRSPLPKVGQASKNVLHVNLDVRSGVPKATVVHPKQQQQHPVRHGDSRSGLGGLPVFSHPHKAHSNSFQHLFHYSSSNNNNNNHHHHHPNSYSSHTSHSGHTNSAAPSQYRESLDEPPKYDEIFKSQVYQAYQGQQGTQKNYEKKPVKSYFFKHFPKAKTFSQLNGENRAENSAYTSSARGGSASGREGCYAEIHIPPTSPNHISGLTHSHLQEEGSSTQHFSQVTQQTGQQTGQHPNKSYTISLKPGHYRINVQWRSKTHPFRITLTPTKRVNGEAPPPSEEQPLYYGTCQAHQEFVNQDVNASLPRRLVHRLLFRQQSPPLECSYHEEQEVSQSQVTNMASHHPQHAHQQIAQQLAPHLQLQQQVAQQQRQLLQQQVGMNPAALGDRKGQKRCWEGGPRQRQRKSRYRWASLSCMHLSSFDDSIGEASGCDSYGGYEGVEHLKRHSLSHLKAVSAESLACGCQGRTPNALTGSSRGMLSVGARGNVGRGGNNVKSLCIGGIGGGGTGGGGNITGRNPFKHDGRSVGVFNNVKHGVTSLGFRGSQSTSRNNYRSNLLRAGMKDIDEKEGVTDDSFIFIEKSQLKCHAVSCDVLQNENNVSNVIVGDYITNHKLTPAPGERKTWHEDEAFIKQVVDEYFKDPAPISDFDEKDSKENAAIPEKIKRITPDQCIGIAPKAKEESDLSSSSSVSSSSSSSTSTSSSSSADDIQEFLENELKCGSPSIDDTTYCDSDDTNSWYTDDSLGYEADAEPSDKDTLGHIWRRWRSAPDVRRTSSDIRVRRMQQLGKFAGAAAAAALGSGKTKPLNADFCGTKASVWWRGAGKRGSGGGGSGSGGGDGVGNQAHRGEGKLTQGPLSSSPYNQLPLCGYQPRKSFSVDDSKLSRLKFGVRKVRKHKLLQFNNYDLSRKPRAAQLVASSKNKHNNNTNKADCNVLTPQEEVDECEFNGTEKLEFVNGKYKAGIETSKCGDGLLYECVRQDVNKVGDVGGDFVGGGSGCGTSVDGGSIDDSTTERTERVLTQGLVVHHSKADRDAHSILNASVIKNALSILREGIASDFAETAKAASVKERGVPNEQGQDKVRDCAEWDTTGKWVNLEAADIIKVKKGVSVGLTNEGTVEDASVNIKDSTCISVEQKRDECQDTYTKSEEAAETENMNRTNITIHLTPPVLRKKGQECLSRSVESTSSVEITLNNPSTTKGCGITLSDEHDKVTDGCLPGFQKSNKNERTYENVDRQGRPAANVLPSGSQKSVWNSSYNFPNSSNTCNVNDRRESANHNRRSISVDSSVRKSDPVSWSRASTISSSSETSSCCHARPKSKPKSSKSQAAVVGESRGHERVRNTSQGDRDRGGGAGGSGTTSSASGQVFGNEYHVQRIQVGTGNNRKFAQATQRSVIEVPVSGSETSDGGPFKTVMKSELVLEPSRSRSSTLKATSKHNHPPTFVSESFPKSQQKTCISEYNIGDAQPNRHTPDAFNRLAHEFKQFKSESKSGKNKKESDAGKKSRKGSSKSKSRSTPIKYFSGILHAFGSAAPKLRGLTTNDEGKGEKKDKEHMRKNVDDEKCYLEKDINEHAIDISLDFPEIKSQISSQSKANRSFERYESKIPSGNIESKGDRKYRKEIDSLSPTSKSDRLQVGDTKDRNAFGPEDSAAVNDAAVAPVPSPRPRRALKNSHESAGNIAPTPPTRRKNVADAYSKALLNGGGNDWGDAEGVGERRWGGEPQPSPRASPRTKRGRQPVKHSFEKNNSLCPQGTQDFDHFTSNDTEIHKASSQTKKHELQYENMKFHEKHAFSKKLVEVDPHVNHYNTDTSSDSNKYIRKSHSKKSKHSSDQKARSEKHRNSFDNKIRSDKHKNTTTDSQLNNKILHSETQEIPSKACGTSNGAADTNNRSSGGGGGGGSGSTNSGGGGGSGGGRGYTSSQGCGGGSGVMDGHGNTSKDGLPGGGWRGGGGQNPGGSGGESSGGASGRRRRVRPPTLPTSPSQSSRPRRHSQTSLTSGGSLPSSPTRWRRPQFEDTWDVLSDEGGRESRHRLSRTPSAESVESEATSFYYSAMGSTVYEDPKSVYEDATARYSYVTCPQYEPVDTETSSQMQSLLKPPGSGTCIPRTISGDVNCDVEVSLSEGEIKVRVRTEDEVVTSSTPIHDDDDDSDDDTDSEDSDSHEYIVSRSAKSREESPEIVFSASETEIGDEIPTIDNEEIKIIGTGVVHAVPCMAGTDSSNWSTLSSSYGKSHERKTENEARAKQTDKRVSGLVHATPCWATTDSDRRSSVSSTDFFSKVCLSVSTEEKTYEPHYENISPVCKDNEPPEEKSVSSEPETQRRRLSGVWTCVEESDDESSEWEDETLPVSLQQSLSKASIGEGEEEDRPDSLQDDITNDYSSIGQDDSSRNNCVSPRSPTSPPFIHEPTWNDPTSMGFSGMPPPPKVNETWEQQQANAWEWHKAVWEHHQKIHEQHLHHMHHQQQQHQSLLADVMSCLGGARWGMAAGNWCSHSFPETPAYGHDEGKYPHLQDSPTPDCRWSGQFQDDPPYQPAGATSPGDLGKPPPSPLPPSGSHRSRDTSSVPRDGARPRSRQRSRSRRRAHSANSKYRVELEIPPHLLLTRQRPSSFGSLAARRPSNPSPEPLEDDLHQEALLYLADASYDHTADANRRRLAERKKNEGNEHYKAKDYREALKLYTQAIDLCPDCAAYYSNRSACYMMLGKYHDALNDAREAVRLDTNFVKGYLRVAKCNVALGDANAALSVLRQASELEPNNRAVRDEMNNAQALLRCLDEVNKAVAKVDYRTAIFHLDRALDQAVGCRNLKITKAEYLVFLQRFADAQEMVNEILQFDSGNADAIYVRGMCLYYQDNPEAAFNHFQHVLRLAPDHQKARDIYKKAKNLKQKKEEGNEAFKRGNFQEAYNLYTDALAIDPLNKHTNAKLYFNRATVSSKLNKCEEAIEDCTAAINLDEGYVKAYLRRAKCYQTLEKHEEAVRDYEKVTRLDRNQEHKRLLQDAKIQLKRSKRKDYYKILGVGKNASEDEIKKSYRKMALVHHPDRHASASDQDKRDHEIKFKEIGEAYSVLTDAKKRAMYDRGQDINDPDGGFGHEGDIDPNQIFQAFFGGHGGHGFGAHASFQQGGFPGGGFSGGSFPGGFHFQFG